MSQADARSSGRPRRDSPGSARLAVPLSELTLEDLPAVGGKNASLGEMIRELDAAGVQVPHGFALTVEAFHMHIREAGLAAWIDSQLAGLDLQDTARLAEAAAGIRRRIREAPLPEVVADAVRSAYAGLCAGSGTPLDVAVRSSATAEDLPAASFAGQHATYLNVSGEAALLEAVRACMASLFTDRAIVYRSEQGISHEGVGLSVGIQRMVRSDLGCAGVMFTLDTESGYRDAVVINGAWGLGETVVQGRVSPDEYWVHKPTALAGFRSIIRREAGDKLVKLVYGDGPHRTVKEVRVPVGDRLRLVLSDAEVLQLANWAMLIERHYSKRTGRPMPMDLEWARDGRTGELYILQARPETVHSQSASATIDIFKLQGKGKVLVRGKSVGGRIGSGPVRIVRGLHDLASFKKGEVLVGEMTDPDWEPVLKRAAAVVTDHGGRTCHAAIVSRELSIPCVVGTGDATARLQDGQDVTVSCAEGDEGRVYEGRVEFARKSLRIDEIPRSPVPLMLNLANPDRAFHLAALPAAGVGLLRIEFLIANRIGIHPMALVHPDRIADGQAAAELRKRTAGYSNPSEYFVDRLSLGVGQIAAAFHPRPVIVRFSDFKTNEYAGLIGGAELEPVESNPMIGFRGASRYYDARYRDAFALECEAIRRVRERMGLQNLKVMIPFCRTVEEGRRVLAEMERNGLVRGESGLEVWVMCELPSNVLLAREFAEIFDGFSIGSNDLTQLTLGIDRDSELLANLFDERDEAVRRMIAAVVKAARECGSPVGICGEAPSNYPDFARWLAEIGIGSISLNPDSLPGVARLLAGSGLAVAGQDG